MLWRRHIQGPPSPPRRLMWAAWLDAACCVAVPASLPQETGLKPFRPDGAGGLEPTSVQSCSCSLARAKQGHCQLFLLSLGLAFPKVSSEPPAPGDAWEDKVNLGGGGGGGNLFTLQRRPRDAAGESQNNYCFISN